MRSAPSCVISRIGLEVERGVFQNKVANTIPRGMYNKVPHDFFDALEIALISQCDLPNLIVFLPTICKSRYLAALYLHLDIVNHFDNEAYSSKMTFGKMSIFQDFPFYTPKVEKLLVNTV